MFRHLKHIIVLPNLSSIYYCNNDILNLAKHRFGVWKFLFLASAFLKVREPWDTCQLCKKPANFAV